MGATTSNRSYPYPQSTDDVRPYQDIQALAEAVDADVDPFLDPCICHCVQTVVQTGWTSATYTPITFTAEVVDSHGIHDTGSNTARFIIGTRLGWWKVSGVYVPAANTARTLKRAVLRKNGTEINGSFNGDFEATSSVIVGEESPVIFVEATNASDYVELCGYMTAASGTLGTAISASAGSSITLEWKRPSL